jgi:hypothetical protein
MPYDISFLTDRHDMEIKKILGEKLFYVLYSMIEKFYSELILIFFPDEFTSLDEMSDDPYSSRF